MGKCNIENTGMLSRIRQVLEDYRAGPMDGDGAIDHPSASLHQPGIQNIYALNIYASAMSGRYFPAPETPIYHLRNKLNVAGGYDFDSRALVQQIQSLPNNGSDVFMVPLTQYGGRVGVLDNDYTIGQDDGITHKVGHGWSLRVMASLTNRGYLIAIEIVDPSEESGVADTNLLVASDEDEEDNDDEDEEENSEVFESIISKSQRLISESNSSVYQGKRTIQEWGLESDYRTILKNMKSTPDSMVIWTFENPDDEYRKRSGFGESAGFKLIKAGSYAIGTKVYNDLFGKPTGTTKRYNIEPTGRFVEYTVVATNYKDEKVSILAEGFSNKNYQSKVGRSMGEIQSLSKPELVKALERAYEDVDEALLYDDPEAVTWATAMLHAIQVRLETLSTKVTKEGYITLPPVDLEQYPPISGMEGPFRFHDGRILYYDPKEGRYYDRKTDIYITIKDSPVT